MEIGYEAYASATGKLDIYSSANGGSTWSSAHTTSNLGTTDPNAYTYIDITADQTWTWTLLNDTNFKVKVVSNFVSGTPAWNLDALVVRVSAHDTSNLDHTFTTYGISLTGDTIVGVWVGIEAYATSSEKIAIQVSSDGGSNWSSSQTSSALAASDPNTTTWFDFTSAYTWTPTLLNDTNFKVKITWTASATPTYSLVSLDYLPVKVEYQTATPDISHSHSSFNLGVIQPSSTNYAKGSAPSNPVTDGECTFTITNSGGVAIDITIQCSNFTGGTGWTLVASNPSTNEVVLQAYYSGQNPASGVVLTTSPQAFYSNLASSATLKWDFKIITGGMTDGTTKTAVITLTASAH